MRAAPVDRRRVLLLRQHQAAARAAQRLVGRGGGDVGVRHRVLVAGEHLARDQAGEVRHVDHQGGADLVGDLAHLGEVHPARVRRVAGHEHQRLELAGLRGDRVVVEQAGLGVGAVLLLVEHLAADVGPEAVGQVAAGVQGHAEQPLVAELAAQLLPVGLGQLVDVLRAEPLQLGRLDAVGQDRPERDQVGVDAGVRLRIGVRRPEQLAGMLGGDRLDGVDVLAAGVEPVADRALGVLVAEPGAHRQQHGRRGVVLARDQLQRRALVGQLLTGRVGDAGFDRGDHLEDGVVGTGGGLGEGVGHVAHPKPGPTDPRLLRATIRTRWLRCRRSTGNQPALAPDALPSHPSGDARDAAIRTRWLRCRRSTGNQLTLAPDALPSHRSGDAGDAADRWIQARAAWRPGERGLPW